MPAFINRVGQRFAHLVVLERAETQFGRTTWLCQCDCGQTCAVFSGNLTSGKQKSCGCQRARYVSEHQQTLQRRKTALWDVYAPMLPISNDPFSNPDEEWRPLPAYEGLYAVSNLGRIMNTRILSGRKRRPCRVPRWGCVMSPHHNHDGYLIIHLCKEGKSTSRGLHGLVLSAFAGPRPDGYVCNHIDGNRENNRVENLEWCTQKANIYNAMERGTHPKGERSSGAKLTEVQVREIRRLEAEGLTQSALARQFGVSTGTVSNIIRRHTWSHIS